MPDTRSWDWCHLQGQFFLCDVLKTTDNSVQTKFLVGFIGRLVLCIHFFVVLLHINRLSVVSRGLFFLAT